MTTETNDSAGLDEDFVGPQLPFDEIVKRAVAHAVAHTSDGDPFGFFIKDHKRLGENDTKVPCVVPGCTGTIIEHRFEEYRGDPMHIIFGPGGRNQMTLVVELYCSHCGILYHHLPKSV